MPDRAEALPFTVTPGIPARLTVEHPPGKRHVISVNVAVVGVRPLATNDKTDQPLFEVDFQVALITQTDTSTGD